MQLWSVLRGHCMGQRTRVVRITSEMSGHWDILIWTTSWGAPDNLGVTWSISGWRRASSSSHFPERKPVAWKSRVAYPNPQARGSRAGVRLGPLLALLWAPRSLSPHLPVGGAAGAWGLPGVCLQTCLGQLPAPSLVFSSLQWDLIVSFPSFVPLHIMSAPAHWES